MENGLATAVNTWLVGSFVGLLIVYCEAEQPKRSHTNTLTVSLSQVQRGKDAKRHLVQRVGHERLVRLPPTPPDILVRR